MLSHGQRGEAKAARYLRRLGYIIVERNFKSPTAEVDIIALDGETLVFVEVKSRQTDTFGSPAEAVGYRKMQKLSEAALFYMSRLKEQPAARFDVLCITKKGWLSKIEHIVDAFALNL